MTLSASIAGVESPRFAPEVLNRPALPLNATLKVVLLNARGGGHLEDILACLRRPPLENADVIMLCEVDVMTRRARRRQVVHELSAALDMSMAYQREFGFTRADGGPPLAFMGNAILCTQPLDRVRGVLLPNLYMRKRFKWLVGGPCGIVAHATFNRRRLVFGVAHLNSRWEPIGRAKQMEDFLAAIVPGAPALIAGDLNTTTVDLRTPDAFAATAWRMLTNPWRFRRPQRYEPLFERLRAAGFGVEGANAPYKPTFTFSRLVPPFFRPKLDWIAARGLRPLPHAAWVVPARRSFIHGRFSDHDFVTCEFEP
ncbi:MAG: endonuclease/exonuclease/phosphatase family protein [Candidatus Binataceae bacterium]